MKEIPKYAILAGEQLGGKIISLERPYIIASVHSYKRDDERVQDMLESMAQERYPIAKVKGYTIFLTLYTSLEPCNDPAFQKEILDEMAQFFMDEKIKQKPGQFMKSEESGALEKKIVREGHRRQRIKRENKPNE